MIRGELFLSGASFMMRRAADAELLVSQHLRAVYSVLRVDFSDAAARTLIWPLFTDPRARRLRFLAARDFSDFRIFHFAGLA